MRVLLSRVKRRKRDERGAVAILVAAMALMLFVLAGFTVDFGLAYNAKRQLQTATDAAALAAAGTYTKLPGTCDALSTPTNINTAANKAVAQAAADKYMAANVADFPTGAHVSLDVTCVSGKLVAHVEWTNTVGTTFGQLAGVDSIDVWREAEATMDVAPKGAGVRPMAVCASDVENKPVGTIVNIWAPGNGHRPPGECPLTDDHGNPGAWWTIDCPEEITSGYPTGQGLTTVLEGQIRNGCQSDVVIVPGQTPTMTATQLSTLLTSYCPTALAHRESCLSSDSGQPDAGQIPDAWQSLITAQTPVVLPTFCGSTNCTPSAVTGQGTGAVFPVRSLAAVQVCGYHWGKQNQTKKKFPVSPAVTGPCAGMPNVWNDNSDDVYLTVALIEFPNDGATSENACQLGSACDNGHRRVRLTK